MRVSQRSGAKRQTLNIRIQPKVRSLIDRAAALAGKNRTDFVLDAARHAAEDTLTSSRDWMPRLSPMNDCAAACKLLPPGKHERDSLISRTAVRSSCTRGFPFGPGVAGRLDKAPGAWQSSQWRFAHLCCLRTATSDRVLRARVRCDRR